MRFFTQTHEVFDGNKPARKTEDHIDCDETTKLKPGKSRAIDAKPQRLTNDHVRIGWLFIGKAPMEKVDDGQDRACERHQCKDKKSPARPDVWKGLSDEEVKSTPAKEHKHEGRDAE